MSLAWDKVFFQKNSGEKGWLAELHRTRTPFALRLRSLPIRPAKSRRLNVSSFVLKCKSDNSRVVEHPKYQFIDLPAAFGQPVTSVKTAD
jgi:hypothetical protein